MVDWIISIATSLAADAIKQIVRLGGRQIRRRFKKDSPREIAFQNALTAALAATIRFLKQMNVASMPAVVKKWHGL